jgi:hypothetical protein
MKPLAIICALIVGVALVWHLAGQAIRATRVSRIDGKAD